MEPTDTTDLQETHSKMDKLRALCPDVRDVPELLEILEAAREAYVTGKAAGPRDLAVQFPKLPREVCRRLVEGFGWRKQRVERLEDLQVSAAVEYADYIRAERSKVAKSIVDKLSPVLGSMAEEVDKVLADKDSKYRTIDARRLAEALAQISGVLLQAVAADGKVPELPESMQEQAGNKGGRQPWLNIHAAGPVTIKGGNDLPPHGAGDEQATGEDR
jgi:hypothetical protein